MKTSLHTRNKDIRNLHRAVPVSRAKELHRAEKKALKELKTLVSEGHLSFWKNRGYNKPPRVSKERLWDFDTPNYMSLTAVGD